MRVWLSSRLSWRLFWSVRHSWRSFRSIRQSASFSVLLSSFLSVLALGPTVILRVYSCLDLGPETGRLQLCRFSKLLLFSFFFCKDGSDRLMKRASYSCCNFLCIVLAAAYLKYRLCRLSCLPFVWHSFFHCDTHTHTHHTHKHTHIRTHKHKHPPTHTRARENMHTHIYTLTHLHTHTWK